MKARILLVLLPLVGACSHQARKVDCEEHLTAINPPTPVVKAPATLPPVTMKPQSVTP
jgi:hypothetical protein